MKKFVFSLMALFAVVSCTNHGEWMTYEEFQAAQYDAAFTNKYGAIDPNHDWGFGSVGTRAVTRAIESSYGFPSDADASKFLTEVPAGVGAYADINYGGGYASGISYIDENMTKEVNIWGQGTAENGWKAYGGTLYVKGNCDFSNRKFYFAGNGSELYLVKGATLTLNAENAANLQEGTMIYVAEGAKIVANGELKLNKGLHIYNHGTIEAASLSTNSESVLYNVGTVNVEGKISVENGESVIVNDGTLTASDLNTAGSGKIQNNGDATISGTTVINSNTNTWVNNGQYETGDFKFTAGSSDVINNCKLTVNNEFLINLGDCEYGIGFYVDGGVVAGSFKMEGPGYIYLASNSVFKVTGTATMNCTKAKYGIYGTGDDWAVFQADEIVAGQADQEYLVTYGGKLAVVTSSHFAQATEGRPYYDVKDAAVIYTGGDAPEVTIPETECNPGFTGKGTTVTPDPDPTPGPEKITYAKRIICEDLGATDDFDFNDVVFDALIDAENGKTYIKLLAAGGTMKLTVAGVEVHEKFGVNVKDMVNTGAGPTKDPVEFVVNQAYTSYADIPVMVELSGEATEYDTKYELRNSIGSAPKKICVDTDYEWTTERQQIEDKYPGFKTWVGNYSIGTSWYK